MNHTGQKNKICSKKIWFWGVLTFTSHLTLGKLFSPHASQFLISKQSLQWFGILPNRVIMYFKLNRNMCVTSFNNMTLSIFSHLAISPVPPNSPVKPLGRTTYKILWDGYCICLLRLPWQRPQTGWLNKKHLFPHCLRG